MMEAHDVIRLAWAHAWQLSLLIASVGVAVRLTARRRPHLAHALWLVVLIKCITPPLWSSPGGVFCWLETAFLPDKRVDVPRDPLAGPPTVVDFGRLGPFQANPTDVVVHLRESSRAAEPIPVDMAAIPPAAAGGRSELARWLLIAWGTGTGLTLAIATWRWRRCLRQLHRHRMPHDAALDAALAGLARRLRLRCRVRLMITTSRFGPAVIGLFRPLIALPEIIVRGKSPAELEPILAHELIHVRRGDLWIGMLQTLAQGLWWFHPFVWIVNRWIAREAERCCDEAVLAMLGCEPARYARCLLDVLEKKRLLRPVPAFPGVRPVEVTSQRLERIMQLRQGSRQRTPWWCWIVMLCLAAVTLPGAAWVAAREEPEDRPDPALLEALRQADRSRRAESAPLGPLVTRNYDLADIEFLTKFSSTAEARDWIAEEIMAAGGNDWTINEWTMSRSHVRLDENDRRRIQQTYHDPAKPQLSFEGASAVVRHDEQGHRQIADRIEQIHRKGYGPLLVEIEFISARPAAVERAVAEWQLFPVPIPAAEERLDRALRIQHTWPAIREGRKGSRSVSSIEQLRPVQFQIVDGDEYYRHIKTVLQADNQTNVLAAPIVTLFNGHTATVRDAVQRPFVIGLKDDQPQIRVIDEGRTLRLRAQLLPAQNEAGAVLAADSGQVKLDFDFEFSEILDVATTTINVAGRAEPVTLQVPRVQSSRVESTVVASLGQTLIVGGLQTGDGKNQRSLLVTMTVRHASRSIKSLSGVGLSSDAGISGQVIIDDDRSAESSKGEVLSNPQTPEDESHQPILVRVYDVADLVLPVPEPPVVHWDGDQSTWRGRRPDLPLETVKADFDPLLDLIQTTVAPHSWESVGGRGAIRSFPTNLCLVVSQTAGIQQQVAELLEQQRHLQDVQVTLETHVLGLTGDFLERVGTDFDFDMVDVCGNGPDGVAVPSGATLTEIQASRAILTDRQASQLLEAVQQQPRDCVSTAPKITLFNGQSATLQLGNQASPYALLLQPWAKADRRSIQLRYSTRSGPDQPKPLEDQPSLSIADGHALLIDTRGQLKPEVFGWSRSSGVPMLSKLPQVNRLFKNMPEHSITCVCVLITPRIVVRERQEALPVRPASLPGE